MSDRASDTAETITAPPKARDRAPLEAADIIRLLQQDAAGTKANSQRAAGAEIEAGDRADDALKLLQELARKSGGDDQARQAQVGQAAAPHAPAPQPGAPQPQALQPQALQP